MGAVLFLQRVYKGAVADFLRSGYTGDDNICFEAFGRFDIYKEINRRKQC
jgi:hypothetical protein